MLSKKLILIVGGVSLLVLLFLVRVKADHPSFNPSFNARDFRGTFAFRMVPVKSFSSDNGATSGLAGAPRQDILRVGTFTATPDSPGATHGTLSGKTIATTDDNNGKTEVIVFTWSGEYKVNPDGTGVFSIADPALGAQTCYDSTASTDPASLPLPGPPPPPLLGGTGTCITDDEGAETYAFVIVKSRQLVEFIETDNGVGGGAKIFLTGTAETREGRDSD